VSPQGDRAPTRTVACQRAPIAGRHGSSRRFRHTLCSHRAGPDGAQSGTHSARVRDRTAAVGCDCPRHPPTRIVSSHRWSKQLELVLDVGDRLVRLVTSETPVVVSNTVPKERRALQALLIKAVSIMHSLLDLARHGHDPDAMILARSLADHLCDDRAVALHVLIVDDHASFRRFARGSNAHRQPQSRFAVFRSSVYYHGDW